jgi:WD40 repeat protein
VAVTPDGRRVLSGSSDNTLRVWDVASGQTLKTLQGHNGGVNAVAITPDGRCVVSEARDKTLRVWDLESGTELVTFTVDGSVSAWRVGPDNRMIVAGDGFGRLHFLRLEGVD